MSSVSNLSPLPVLSAGPRMELPSLKSISLNTNKLYSSNTLSMNTDTLPSLPSSPVYIKASPIYSPPSPENSLSDISMPLSKPLLSKPLLSKPLLSKPLLSKPLLSKPLLSKPLLNIPLSPQKTLQIPLKENCKYDEDRNIKCCGWK